VLRSDPIMAEAAAQPQGTAMTQLVFDLAGAAACGRADFITSPSNAAALGWVERWPAWPASVLVVHGPEGSGKTHLAHLWCERAGAKLHLGAALAEADIAAVLSQRQPTVAVDNADRAANQTLLHVFNAVVETRGSLFLTARHPPGVWHPALADLASRLRTAAVVGIELPGDSLLAAVLAKHFADRQVRVTPAVVVYLVRHMERSLAAAGEIVAALDRAALRRGGRVNTRLAAEILTGGAGHSSSSSGSAESGT
jgi:chromosomal replication initiation ATPase DnaA